MFRAVDIFFNGWYKTSLADLKIPTWPLIIKGQTLKNNSAFMDFFPVTAIALENTEAGVFGREIVSPCLPEIKKINKKIG